MASLDFRSHCRPHGFDSIVRKRERRLRPFLTSLWERETSTFPLRFGAWRRGRSFDLYATGVAAGSAPRVYRLIPSPIDVPGTLPLEPDGLAPLLGSPAGSDGIPFARIPARNRTDRLRMARGVIQSWEEETDNILRASHDFVGLSARSRHLLYALGGTAAAGFLAEAARGRFDGTSAETARKAVHDATSKLRKIVE